MSAITTSTAASKPARLIRVLVVDDSALIRKILAEIINAQSDMECVGAARDPYIAREMVRTLRPDVMTLDIEMPRMDGLEFLEKLMRLKPMPVVMVSTLTEKGADVTLRALEMGAVDFVSKPKLVIEAGVKSSASEITEKIRSAAGARLRSSPLVVPEPAEAPAQPARPLRLLRPLKGGTEKIVAVGASTGGTEAIRELLERLPPESPAFVITQHMPPGFTRSFAQRLNGLCRIRVKEAEHGERILPGHAYIAPGDRHLEVGRSGANYVALLSDGPLVNRHKPSVEVLFNSVAKQLGANAVGVMLTGMGKDGAVAMGNMRRAGAYNIAQDEKTCVVFGMPREAIHVGAVDEVLPLPKIAARVLEKIDAGDILHRI